MFSFFSLILLILLCVAPSARADDYSPECDAWPLFRYWTSPENGERNAEALWPFFEWSDQDDRSSVALRPLYNRRNDKASDVVESEWPWPFGFGTARPDLSRQVWYPFFVRDRETFSDGAVQHRWWLLPLFILKTGRGPTDFMLFPLYGRLHKFFNREKATFVLWPLYLHQTGEQAQSWSVPHPFITYVRWNDGGRGYKLWPLFGVNRRPGKMLNLFALWPLFTKQWAQDEEGTYNRLLIFPLYGRIDDPKGWERSILYPFFGRRVDNNMGTDQWWYPWPFLGHRTGKRLNGLTIWPFYTTEQAGHETYTQFLWPLGWLSRDRTEGHESMSLRVVPLFINEWEQTNAGRTGAWQIWPLVKRRNETEGVHLEVPSVFPVRWHAELERNFGPFFRLFEYRRDTKALKSWRLLWRLVRVDRGPENRYFEVMPLFKTYRQGRVTPRSGWSVLKGLVGRERTQNGARWRLFYLIHFGAAASKTGEDDSTP